MAKGLDFFCDTWSFEPKPCLAELDMTAVMNLAGARSPVTGARLLAPCSRIEHPAYFSLLRASLGMNRRSPVLSSGRSMRELRHSAKRRRLEWIVRSACHDYQ